MKAKAHFPDPLLQSLSAAKILGVRAGGVHRFTGIWVVVIENRVFVRSWNDKPTGWFRAFRDDPLGSISVGDREIKVRAKHIRSDRVKESVTRAFAAKYNTRASAKWVSGFAEPHRMDTTLEFVPV